jgi:hypothetical protein
MKTRRIASPLELIGRKEPGQPREVKGRPDSMIGHCCSWCCPSEPFGQPLEAESRSLGDVVRRWPK